MAITDLFSLLLRTMMILAGLAGFIVGFGLGWWRETTLTTALVRGAGLCIVFTCVVRWLFINIFRAYLKQAQIRKQEQNKAAKA